MVWKYGVQNTVFDHGLWYTGREYSVRSWWEISGALGGANTVSDHGLQICGAPGE
jgi:hypothetical protein